MKFFIKGYKKNKYSTNILTIRIHNFLLDWFIDCGEWFIYLHFPSQSIRFSGAGNMIEKHTKTNHIKWLNEYRSQE
jgi:hypothetical protein